MLGYENRWAAKGLRADVLERLSPEVGRVIKGSVLQTSDSPVVRYGVLLEAPTVELKDKITAELPETELLTSYVEIVVIPADEIK